jgi:hypothetical protein
MIVTEALLSHSVSVSDGLLNGTSPPPFPFSLVPRPGPAALSSREGAVAQTTPPCLNEGGERESRLSRFTAQSLAAM